MTEKDKGLAMTALPLHNPWRKRRRTRKASETDNHDDTTLTLPSASLWKLLERRRRLTLSDVSHGVTSSTTREIRSLGQETLTGGETPEVNPAAPKRQGTKDLKTLLHNRTQSIQDFVQNQTPLETAVFLQRGRASQQWNPNRGSNHGDKEQFAALPRDPWNSTMTSRILILVLHLIFVIHWKRGRPSTRRTAEGHRKTMPYVSYRTLVRHKQFYKMWWAWLSHPPWTIHRIQNPQTNGDRRPEDREPTNHDSRTPRSNSVLIGFGHADDESEPLVQRSGEHASTLLDQGASMVRLLTSKLTTESAQGTLYGFGLMLYNCHVLWSCRALEGYYQADALQYFRVLVGLASTALLCELWLVRQCLQIVWKLHAWSLVRRLDDDNDRQDDWGLPLHPELQVQRMLPMMKKLRRFLLHRRMSGLTSLSVSLLMVFRSQFPRVPTPILPFVHNPFFLLHPTITCSIVIIILFALTLQHQEGNAKLAASISPWLTLVCGWFSGTLWNIGITSCLATFSWGTGWVVFLMLASLVTAKTDPFWGPWLFCIGEVSWDHRGRIIAHESTDNNSLPSPPESDSESSSDDDNPYRPRSLFQRRETDELERAFPPQDDDQIYGLLPEMGNMEDDDDDDPGASLELPSISRSSMGHVRSRRAPHNMA